MKWNRKMLLAKARAMGFKGASLEDLKAWAQAEGVEFAADDAGTKAVNLDEAWAKTVYVTADAGEEVVVDQPEMEGEAMADPEEEEPVAKRRTTTARDVAKAMGATPAARAPSRKSVPDFVAQSHKKAYNRAAQTGGTYNGQRPVFSDADEAEYFAAGARLAACNGKAYSQRARDMEIVGTKAGSTLDNAYAGVLVVHQTAPQIIDLLHTYGAARQLAGVTPMPDGEYRVNRKTADMTFAYEGEGDEIAETNPSFDQVRLIANKLAGIGRLSNELLDDAAFNVADLIAKSSASGLAKQEDNTYFFGTGLGNFTGVSGAIDSDSQFDATLATNWGDYTIDKLQNWVAKVPLEAWRSGTVKIACSSAFYHAVLRRFALSAGGNLGGSILDGVGGGFAWDGIPVVLTEVLPSTYLANQKVAYIGSFERGTKIGIVTGSEQIDATDQVYWKNDQFAWRIKERIAYNTHDVGGTASEVIALVD